MSSKHKKIGKFKKIFTIMSHNADCGCANPNPTQVSVPKPISEAHKPAPPPPPPPIRRPSSSACQSNYVDDEEEYSSSTASATVGSTSSHFSRSLNDDDDEGGKIGSHFRGSVAVVKESDDPYLDFRQSMIQMMAARDMWSEEGLEELLKCFLRLNSPVHHEIIIQAFTEIRHGGAGGISNRRR
ncbi:PREDICTED: transcription repressor OFP8-like [Ipomoea nil]|uniref:transcription repressor OFP8-like n=1 Tax=Ipomoea nil TaxID=35883 RepID=UPI000900E51B|nr:PREDICTED: transcription repressor OFP8-like [Ipomoea nil]